MAANQLTITQKYSSALLFQDFLDNISITDRLRVKLISDEFSDMRTLVNHYRVAGPHDFEKYLKDTNKTFATASIVALKVYFNPV